MDFSDPHIPIVCVTLLLQGLHLLSPLYNAVQGHLIRLHVYRKIISFASVQRLASILKPLVW